MTTEKELSEIITQSSTHWLPRLAAQEWADRARALEVEVAKLREKNRYLYGDTCDLLRRTVILTGVESERDALRDQLQNLRGKIRELADDVAMMGHPAVALSLRICLMPEEEAK